MDQVLCVFEVAINVACLQSKSNLIEIFIVDFIGNKISEIHQSVSASGVVCSPTVPFCVIFDFE